MREIFAIAAGIIIVVSMGFVVAGGLSKKDCKQCVENFRLEVKEIKQ